MDCFLHMRKPVYHTHCDTLTIQLFTGKHGLPSALRLKRDVKNQLSAAVSKTKKSFHINRLIQPPAPGECVVRKSGRSGLMPVGNMIDPYSLSESY